MTGRVERRAAALPGGVLLVAALAGLVAGAAGAVIVEAVRPPAPAPRAVERRDEPGWVDAVARVEDRLETLETRASRERDEARAAASPQVARDEARSEAPAAGEIDDGPETAAGSGSAEAGGDDPLEGLLGHTFGNRDSERLFGRLGRHPETIDATIKRLQEAVKKDPGNADLHCALATAFVAKTAYATPQGPQQGTVWAFAEAEYDRAIEADPNHWQARYGKAFGASMAPEFVGLRPAAIRQFEELMTIQETQAPDPQQVLVYVRLGTLYKDAGNVGKAREIWERGAKRFPDDKRLAEQIGLLQER